MQIKRLIQNEINLLWQHINDPGLHTSKYVDVWGEQPAISVGSPWIGPLANVPEDGTLRVYLRGLRLALGTSLDFTWHGTYLRLENKEIKSAGDSIVVDYRYDSTLPSRAFSVAMVLPSKPRRARVERVDRRKRINRDAGVLY